MLDLKHMSLELSLGLSFISQEYEEVDEETKEEDGIIMWACCDMCDKWRILPKSASMPSKDASFTCKENGRLCQEADDYDREEPVTSPCSVAPSLHPLQPVPEGGQQQAQARETTEAAREAPITPTSCRGGGYYVVMGATIP